MRYRLMLNHHSCGKTTLSRLLAKEANCIFKELSATSSGINDVRNIFEEAKGSLALTRRYAGDLYHDVPLTTSLAGKPFYFWMRSIVSINHSKYVSLPSEMPDLI
jgi:hypothetical protein